MAGIPLPGMGMVKLQKLLALPEYTLKITLVGRSAVMLVRKAKALEAVKSKSSRPVGSKVLYPSFPSY